jgi:hypothetical protein
VNANDFRRIALSFEGAEQGSHAGAVDFRVGGRIFATLASRKLGYGNLIISPDLQADLIRERPDLFLPIAGGWGRMGMTHVRLAEATEADLKHALGRAWLLRVEKNTSARATKRSVKPRSRATTKRSAKPRSRATTKRAAK